MITQQVKADMIQAMKAREQVKLDTLRGALTSFTNELVAKGRKPTESLTDDEALAVLKRLAKQRKDAMAQYAAGARQELADKEAAELAIIEAYLPQKPSREEIERVAKEKRDTLGITDVSGIGKLTGAIMKEFAGRADGDDVKEVVASLF